jgi:hypothetical protein
VTTYFLIEIRIGFFFSLTLQPQFGPWPTSIKLSVSLRFSRPYTVGRTPWAGDQLIAMPLPVHKHRKTHTHTHTLNSHTMCRIRTHDPGFRAREDSACLRPLGYSVRLFESDASGMLSPPPFPPSYFMPLHQRIQLCTAVWDVLNYDEYGR